MLYEHDIKEYQFHDYLIDKFVILRKLCEINPECFEILSCFINCVIDHTTCKSANSTIQVDVKAEIKKQYLKITFFQFNDSLRKQNNIL